MMYMLLKCQLYNVNLQENDFFRIKLTCVNDNMKAYQQKLSLIDCLSNIAKIVNDVNPKQREINGQKKPF